ncbi:Uncharacterised protein [Mycobacteroides abscessus subsp. abscessus]|nr:Uncharacterised protein [Mycobacteroides abscessus subsp. abscessus]
MLGDGFVPCVPTDDQQTILKPLVFLGHWATPTAVTGSGGQVVA